jgi:hypothetical protein
MHGGDVDDSGRHVLSGINDDALSEDDGDENSIHENPDADLLAFNVEMGMVPMSSVNSLGGLAGSDTDAPRRRQKRINSHSEPLGDMVTQGATPRAASPRAASPRAASGIQDSAEAPAPPRHVARAVSADSYGGAITNSGALFDYFTGSQDSWDQDGQGGTGAAGQPTSARRRSSKGTGPGETVLHKYGCCCYCCCFLPLCLVASVLLDGCTLHTTASLLQFRSVNRRRAPYLTCTTTVLQDHKHGVVLL